MTLGFIAALLGLPLPRVEPMILASVIALGVLVAVAARPSMGAAVTAVLAFGLFHGYAHGTELGAASAVIFGAGLPVWHGGAARTGGRLRRDSARRALAPDPGGNGDGTGGRRPLLRLT